MNINGGNNYVFRVVAKNIYGAGTVSEPVNVTAIDVPGKMSIPVVQNVGTTVVVTYTAPTTHSSDIIQYDV